MSVSGEAIAVGAAGAGQGAELAALVEVARDDARRAAHVAGVRVFEAHDEATTRLIFEAGEGVWGPGGTFAPNELRALAFSGNPVHLALDDSSRVVGFAVGFLGWAPSLHVHSHQAGVLPAHRRRGVGYALKLAQRHTCLRHGFMEMRWTFDPLVRRNVAFNLNALGARAVAFHPDFYGSMSDTINAGDASDRLEAVWDLTRSLPQRATGPDRAEQATGTNEPPAAPVLLRDIDGEPHLTGLPARGGAVLEVPADYERLRVDDRSRSTRWRRAVREQLTAAYAAGLQVGAVDPEGYRLVRGGVVTLGPGQDPDGRPGPDQTRSLLPELTARTGAMVDLLDALVSSESPSNHPGLLAATATLLGERGTRVLGTAPEPLDAAGTPALCWSLPGAGCSSGPVLVLGHLDTVWPAGTLARWPFRVEDDRATGPGAFDMKAGLVQALHGLAALTVLDLPRPPVVLLVTADEEVGSPGGRHLIASHAAGAVAVLVPEASEQGRLKVARKGVSAYDLHIGGRAAHAGLEPHRGVNALLAAAQLVLEVADLAAPALGTTVTPTTATAGTTRNTVPASASATVDVRAATIAEQQRVDTALRGLQPRDGATLRIEGGIDRPPMEEHSAAALFALAQAAADTLGLPPLQGARVGGGSDGNLTAALGIPTLDGLGAVGAGAHAEGEYALVSSMPERAALLAALIVEIGRQHGETDRH